MNICKIKEVCQVNPPKKIPLSQDTDISFVPMSAVSTDGKVDLSEVITVEKVKSLSVFKDGDVIFAKITPCMENGKGAVVSNLKNGYGAGSTEFTVLRPNETHISEKWLYYYLSQKHFRWTCQQNMTGSAGQKRVPAKYLAECLIPVPPLEEQQRIVARIEELFSELDAAEKDLNLVKKKLLQYRRAVVKEALTPALHPEIQWTETVIENVCDCLDSRRKPVKKSERSSGSGIYPYYGANGITGMIDDYLFDEELVLVVEDETFVGRVKPFSYIIRGKSWVNNHAHILRGKDGIITNEYLNYLLSYYPFLPLTTGTTGRKKLTKKALMNAPIHVAEYKCQSAIVSEIESRLSVCDKIEETVNTALQEAEAMRQSILKQAFAGEL